MLSRSFFVVLLSVLFLTGCGSRGESAAGEPAIEGVPVGGAPASGNRDAAPSPSAVNGLVEGRDYMVVNRVRFLDRMGFDQPVEAFSILFPRGWRTEGGVQWGAIQGCRGEFVRNHVKATSPDGAWQFETPMMRSFSWTSDAMLLQTMQAGAQAGGCAINRPFTAQQYIEGFARQELKALAANIRLDEGRLAVFRTLDEQANNIARQYGNQSRQESSVAQGELSFPDGSEGILLATVVNAVMNKPDFLNGGATQITTTAAMPFVMRCPAGRREECARMFNMIMASDRVNPVWREAKDRFLGRLGQMEHAASMDRIRLMGEQSRAYARAQSDAADRNMRDWESRQASQDQQHKRFVQTIREVETWKDSGGGSVELTSGYSQAWSRGDGSYVLSNSPGFDPNSAFRDQNWKQMQREQ